MADLPDIQFVETDVSIIEQRMIARFQALRGQVLGPADPRRLLLSSISFDLGLVYAAIDQTGKRNLLAYADGDYLDHQGDHVVTARLAATYSNCTLRFSLDEALGFDVTIPAGSRATPGDDLIWATDETAVITAGNTYVDVEATCQTAGAAGNGYLAGQIASMVDAIDYVTGVANTNTSLYGSDAESDAHYLARIHLAPERFAIGGPELAYVYHALSAHPDVIDASAITPTPGAVTVTVLVSGGGAPSQAILDAVTAAISGKKARPLTDSPTVQGPEQVAFDTTLTYYVKTDSAALADSIATAVAQTVDEYHAWQTAKLGRDINPTELIGRLQRISGMKRVEVTAPAYAALGLDEVASANAATITDGGLENG